MKRFDFSGVTARISTWLGILSAMLGAGAIAFAAMPSKWQDEFPEGLGGLLAMAAVGCAMLVPLATSFKQKRFQPDDTDKAGA